jgi:hypothetical protein
MSEYVTDCFGERCRVLDRCSSCGAPRYRREGERGWQQFHKDCLRAGSIGNEGHVQAKEWSEQSMERDHKEARDRGDFVPSYDSHRAAPNPHEGFGIGIHEPKE